MNLAFCGCRACRYGLHHNKFSKAKARSAIKHGRQMTRIYLKFGRFDELPTRISVSYTD